MDQEQHAPDVTDDTWWQIVGWRWTDSASIVTTTLESRPVKLAELREVEALTIQCRACLSSRRVSRGSAEARCRVAGIRAIESLIAFLRAISPRCTCCAFDGSMDPQSWIAERDEQVPVSVNMPRWAVRQLLGASAAPVKG